jgi:hypothetical protein
MSLSAEDRELVIEFAKTLGVHVSKDGWENFAHNIINKNALRFRFQTIEQVCKVNEFVGDLNRRNGYPAITMRTAAGGKGTEYSQSFSFTDCVGADTDIVCHLLGAEDSPFFEITVVDPVRKIVRFGANVQVGTADKIGYENREISANLPTASLIPYPTVVGLLMNAGHGTGKDQPAVAGLVEAITICGPDGKIRRIDRNDPKYGGAKFDTLIGANMGLFGTVLNVELRCRPAAKIKSTLIKTNIAQFEKMVAEGLFDKYPYVSAMYMPTYRQDELKETCEPNLEVVIWEPVDNELELAETHNEDKHNHPETRFIEQEASIRINDAINIPQLLSAHKQLIPYMMRLIAAIEIGNQNETTVGPWGTQAHYQVAYPAPKPPATLDDVDCLFPTTGTNCPEIVSALKHVAGRLGELAKQNIFPVIDAIYLRYFKGFKGGLSTSSFTHGDHVCAFDIVSSANIPGWQVFKLEMMQYFINALDAKLHLGKTVLVDGKFPVDNYMSRAYGQHYTDFINLLKEYYEECELPLEKSPYINDFNKTLLAEGMGWKLTPSEEKPTPHIMTKAELAHSYQLAENLLGHLETNCKQHVNNMHFQRIHKHLTQLVSLNNPLFAKNNSLFNKTPETTTRCCAPKLPSCTIQ